MLVAIFYPSFYNFFSSQENVENILEIKYFSCCFYGGRSNFVGKKVGNIIRSRCSSGCGR